MPRNEATLFAFASAAVTHEALQASVDPAFGKVVEVDDHDAELLGAVAHAEAAALRRDDGGAGHHPAKAVAQDGKLVEGLCLDIADLAAYKHRCHTAGAHHVQFIADGLDLLISLPVHNDAGTHVLKQARVEAGFVDIELQHAADIPQPGADLTALEVKRDRFARHDHEILQEADPLQTLQGLRRCLDPASPLPFHLVFSMHEEAGVAVILGLRDTLHIIHSPFPVPPMLEIELEKGVDNIQILRQDRVVDPPLAYGTARHQEEILHRVDDGAGQGLLENGAANIIEAVFAPAVCKDRDGALGAQKPCREQHRIGAAGDVDGAVRILADDTPEQLKHGTGLIETALDDAQLRIKAAPPEIEAQRFQDRLYVADLLGTDIDDPLGPEHLHAQHVFERPLIIQFDQCLHTLTSCSPSYNLFPLCARRIWARRKMLRLCLAGSSFCSAPIIMPMVYTLLRKESPAPARRQRQRPSSRCRC